ncbi:phosphate ABC transporter permease subunit PstC [Shewanella eurypsychrophilus]|uniref:Phosphate transport system permease protein n=1 Tax=Shewanella eurypsychrophilus TaxID=2593656 RepID=A0ABX6VD14_9GAMM|nr:MULTISPECIES: phosphate ABC transporter permease subunit PstC [Shewanella]QFU25057.1 phosphate ABC transporter permease subunit PstC [Shewanella sp. YLB-09]QPG60232.1 phosphate ABC transporter permease subunit PstC [Shewanella eurypsychrophilus]
MNTASKACTTGLQLAPAKVIDWKEFFFHILFLASAMVGVISVATIGWFVFQEGLPAFKEAGVVNMVLGREWLPPALYGIFPMIIATLISTTGAVIIGVPIAILTAVFLAELAPKWLADIIRPAVELLAGIPSVVYGFFGLVIIVPTIETIFNIPAGNTLLAGIIVLAIMILPTVITISETSLRALPPVYKEGALALGASHIYSIFKVLIPAARSGIFTGVALGIARAIGETMAIIMVMGNAPAMPGSILEPARTLTANIAMEMSYATGIHSSALYSTGIVLLVFIVLLNASLLYLNRKRSY